MTGLILRELESALRERLGRERRRRAPWPDEPPSRDRRPPPDWGAHSEPLVMPVAGVRWSDLRDTYGAPRGGGRRHEGIDIFAPRWRAVLAATSGTVIAIGSGGRAGRSLRLAGDDGRSYFYAHLQGWARGVREGIAVAPGDVVAYVGNSGNAARSPTHLHFEIEHRGRAINPYPVLADAEYAPGPTRRAGLGRAARAAD